MKKIILFLMMAMFLSWNMMAQTQTVKGIVVDESGEPIIGASVYIKGGSDRNFTDLDGNFSIKVSLSDVLVFSCIGYETKEISVGNQTFLNVTLEDDGIIRAWKEQLDKFRKSGKEFLIENERLIAVNTQKSEIIIPQGVKIISDFSNNESVTSVIFPVGLKEIGLSAFSDCKNLKNVIFNSELEIIGISAFRNCSSLELLNLPPSVTSIGKSAFEYCDNLKSINIPSSVTSIEKDLFSGCSKLKLIKLPSSIKYIGESAFYDCESLESIDLPSSITHIGEYVFSGCNNLRSIICNWKSPIEVDDIFNWVQYNEGILSVPKGSKPAYENAEVWGDFKKIIER